MSKKEIAIKKYLKESRIRDLVSFIQRDEGVTPLKAMDMVYNSDLYELLSNYNTGLYSEGPLYIYDMLLEEISRHA
ncbi:MAG: hypothetical protein M0Z41_11530 [Peptococcaceae bacterium]|jgi:hypothetical protein|nr:hypothetical protein [Peptococcaceae bacterium]